jgi:hypothetical protein
MQRYRKIKIILIGILTAHVIIYDITRVVQENGHDIGKTGQIFIIVALILKMVSDCCMFYFFIKTFSFFIMKKRQTRQKEALGLSLLNKFIIASVCVMFFMRILGTLFNTFVGVSTMFDFYHDPGYINFRVLMANIVFPLRDFIEVLFFCYLFFI